MYVKKRMSLLLFAALAMVLFTACGRWDFSREAAKAANEAQGETLRVEFTVEQKFTNALRAALEENIQPADVEKAMRADESIEPFLTSGYRLDVYPLRADISAKDAAKQLAAEFVNRLAGCEDKGYISMVKADNGYFYEAVLTYKHGSSGGSSGGSTDDDGGTTAATYEVTINASNGGTVNTKTTTITADETFEFTVTPNKHFNATAKVTEGNGTLTQNGNTFTLSGVTSDVVIQVNFEQVEFSITVTWEGEGKVWCDTIERNIEKDETIIVNKNEYITFTFEPDTGYEVKEITRIEDDESYPVEDPNNTYTVNVSSDEEIHVVFGKQTHTITVQVTGESYGQVKDKNGELSGTIIKLQVEDGKDIYLEFDAKDGCVIESLVIDEDTIEEFDVMQAAGEGGKDHKEYTFKVVDEDHTVHVTFKNEEET